LFRGASIGPRNGPNHYNTPSSSKNQAQTEKKRRKSRA
jgi:hypothetical protein